MNEDDCSNAGLASGLEGKAYQPFVQLLQGDHDLMMTSERHCQHAHVGHEQKQILG